MANERVLNPNLTNQPDVETNVPFEKRQKGTGFTNINRILGANVGAGQQLASRIGGAISSQGQRVQQGLGQARQQFQTGFQQARQQALANIGTASSLTRQPNETDEQYEARVAAQNQDYSQIGQKLRTAEYTGPTGFENPNILLSQAQSAGKLGTFTRSGLGQGILARQYAGGRGEYGLGQNILDQLFLGQDVNAQKALQQARQNVVNLEQNVQSASQLAKEASKSTQTGIEAARNKAIEDIQKSSKGILSRGKEGAEQFNKQMQSLKNLLMGVDEAGNPITNITPEQQDLLNKIDQYGIQNASLYLGRGNINQSEIDSILSQVASGMVLNPANALNLTDVQRQAAINLAQLQNDPSLQQQMLQNKFDTNVFKRDVSKLTENINANLKADTETRDILTRAGNYMKSVEDPIIKQNTQKRDLNLIRLGQEQDWVNRYGKEGAVYYQQAKDAINDEFNRAQAGLLGQGTPFDPRGLDFVNLDFSPQSPADLQKAQQAQKSRENLNEMMQQFGIDTSYGGGSGFDYDVGAGRQIYEGLASAIGGNYGWLPFGDRSADIDYGGADSIDPRFRGLGLTFTPGRGSGGLRSSVDFFKAAERARGQTKTVRDIILERIARNRGEA
jgi:hypothetical protein